MANRIARASLVFLLLFVFVSRPSGQRPATAGELSIYFIDVEGGQSTLIVAPTGESMLVDAGYADDDRDPRRIMAAARDAGVKQIDALVVTHFHADHDGGVPEVARQLPIRQFLDVGDILRTPAAIADRDWLLTLARYDAYVRARGDVYRNGLAPFLGKPHVEPQPGYSMSIGAASVTFVSHDGATIKQPLPGAGQATSGCPAAPPEMQEKNENARSNGFVLQFGRFRFLDIGDLVGSPLYSIVCPRSLVGPVDVYLVSHHGGVDSSYPATFDAFKPRVAIVNNGATKGGAPEVFDTIRHASWLEGSWQLHASRNAGVTNLAPSHIANLDETTSHWIKLSAREDGSFRVTNSRTGKITTFTAK